MCRASALLADLHDPVRRAGDGAADVDQIALRIDLFDAQVGLRMPLVAVLTRHRLPLDDTRRIGTRSDGAGTAMLRVAVRVRTTARLVALHDALEPAALRRAGDLHLIADREHPDVHDVANRVRRDLRVLARRIVETERAQHAGRVVEPRLRRVTELGAVRATSARLPLAL